jgi:large subunit ribosomal protein L28
MAKCQLTGKARTVGHKVSHSNIKTNIVNHANVQKRRVYDPITKKTLTLYVSTRTLRTLDKLGLQGFIRKYGSHDPKVTRALGIKTAV